MTFWRRLPRKSKLNLIREYQTGGRLVAMTGDGTNDAPALAQADVAVAMNTGTQPAREAANMIDLDSNPTKLIEIVEIGKQLLMTRGSLTTFSIANDVAKYFAIIPAAFASTYPQLGVLNFMRLSSPESAILSAVIFNALIIIAADPAGAAGVPYRAVGAAQLLRDNLLDLWPGWADRPLYRYQTDRHAAGRVGVRFHPALALALGYRSVNYWKGKIKMETRWSETRMVERFSSLLPLMAILGYLEVHLQLSAYRAHPGAADDPGIDRFSGQQLGFSQ